MDWLKSIHHNLREGTLTYGLVKGSFPVIMMNGLQPVHMPGFIPCDYDEWISTSSSARVSSL